ncbi:MAG: Na+/H+ antiporter subunit E [Ignavibacteriae bacterium]|nr:Na+/H+ antiporter subunit E [Ignavibacteriota bacterium]NOG97855.1 Na+/H+ antiporter subunit E [Ignavibacteriota bacterium]
MNRLLLNILLAIAWMLLTGDLDFMNFIQGLIIGFLILWVSKNATDSREYISKIPKIFGFIIYFIYELILANLKVAYDIITPKHRMKPSIIAVPLTAEKDFEITILANLITLTPGTLSLDVSSDKKVLYVHSMYASDPEEFIKEIKNGFERKLLEITR